MKATDILAELKALGKASYKKVLLNHGVKEPCFGVKISELKEILKRTKKDYQLALELFATGNYDAMYLAGLMADDARMSREDLTLWVNHTQGGGISSWTVPGVAAGSHHGWELAMEWIESEEEKIAVSGWATLNGIVSIKPDAELDTAALKRLLLRVKKSIHAAQNDVRYHMNSFVIAVGCYVPALTELALETARAIGEVTVDFGATACQVPAAVESIEKVKARGTIGKKRKSAKC